MPALAVIAESKPTKPCPEQSEGTLEIATGYALATTLGRIATPFWLAIKWPDIKCVCIRYGFNLERLAYPHVFLYSKLPVIL